MAVPVRAVLPCGGDCLAVMAYIYGDDFLAVPVTPKYGGNYLAVMQYV